MNKLLLPCCLMVASCSIISDQDLSKFPSAHLKSLTITREDNGQELTGLLSYEGGYSSPSKITIDWGGDLRLFQVPVWVPFSEYKIAQTIYEFSGPRIIKITNINDKQVSVGIDNFSYDNGRLTEHTITETHNDSTWTFKNDFYYNDAVLSYVFQTRCIQSNCYHGYFLNQADPGNSGDNQTSGNFFVSIIPLDSIVGNSYWYQNYNVSQYPYKKKNGKYYSNDDNLNIGSAFQNPSQGRQNDSGGITYFDAFFYDNITDNVILNVTDSPYYYAFDVSNRNAEYLLAMYYKVGELITQGKDVYGENNNSWILPRLKLSIDYVNYIRAGYDLGYNLAADKRSFRVDFENTF